MNYKLITLLIFLFITMGISTSVQAGKGTDNSEPHIQNVNINGVEATLLGFQVYMQGDEYVPINATHTAMENGLHSGVYDVLTVIQDGRELIRGGTSNFDYQLNHITGTLGINSGVLAKFSEQSLQAQSEYLIKLSSSLEIAPEISLHFFVHHPMRSLEPFVNGGTFSFDSITASLDEQALNEESLVNLLSESSSFSQQLIAIRIDHHEIPQDQAETQLSEGRFYIRNVVDNGLVPETETEIYIEGDLNGKVLRVKWIRHEPRKGIPYGDDALGLEDPSDPNSASVRFNLQGNAWPCGDITFFLANGTADIAGNAELVAVRDAFAIWEDAVNLDFIEVGNAAAADIVVLWGAGNHGIADPADNNFDGVNGVLAHAFFPPPLPALADPTLAGDVHFDEGETWTLAIANNGNQPIDLLTVAIHEIGHSLGLRHSSESGAIMNDTYTGSQRFLGQDDVAGINAIYGGCPGIGSLHYSGTTNGALFLTPPDVGTLDFGDTSLLNIFSFRYNSSDHHLERIAALPPMRIDGGNGVTITLDGTVAYHDKNEDDLFAYIADWLVYPDPANNNANVGAVANPSCAGQCTFNITGDRPSPDHVFVLNGFDFTFQNGDHHIDEIEVAEANGILTVSYNDKNDDDPFSVAIQFTYLPPWDVANTVDVGRNSTNGSDTRLTGLTNVTAIAGFHFDFLDDDHHIRKVSVDTGAPNLVEVDYFDKNADDQYSWTVRVVELIE